ncbi:MAG: c-type cytochrome [Gemmatimonadales bacterium]
MQSTISLVSRRSGWLLALLLALGSARANAQSADAGKTIELTDIEFHPGRLMAQPGDTLTFVNKDEFEHDVYIVRAANRNVVVVPPTTIQPGETLHVPIGQKGVFNLYCTIHGGMTGKITTTGSFELSQEEKQQVAALKTLPPIVKTGETLFWGDAQCSHCHKIGDRGEGARGPNLADIGFRAGPRGQKLGLGSATGYLIQSIMEPGAYVVEGYTNDMATVYQPPIDLSAEQIQAVVSYLQSQGGEVDTWAMDINEQKLATLPQMNPFRNGDPERGREVWDDMGCNSCHTVGDEPGTSAGPDLTAIGAYRNWTWLAESLLEPNKEIGKNWVYTTVYYEPEDSRFVSEKSVDGFIRKNDANGVQILTMSKEIMSIPANKLKRVEPSETSKMPTNYGELLTFEQTADLIAYLLSIK